MWNTFAWCTLQSQSTLPQLREAAEVAAHNSRELSRHSHHHQLPHTSDLEGNDPGVPRIGPVHLQKRKVQDLHLPVG